MKIALVGVAGSGKDYLANHLVKKYRYAAVSFAKPLKIITNSIFTEIPIDPPPEEKEKIIESLGISPRDAWIKVAKTLREIDDQIFVKKTKQTLDMIHSNNVIITDVRDKIEFEAVKVWGFTTIHIIAEKPFHPKNDYDQKIQEFVDLVDFKFENDFLSIEKWDEFAKEYLCIP